MHNFLNFLQFLYSKKINLETLRVNKKFDKSFVLKIEGDIWIEFV